MNIETVSFSPIYMTDKVIFGSGDSTLAYVDAAEHVVQLSTFSLSTFNNNEISNYLTSADLSNSVSATLSTMPLSAFDSNKISAYLLSSELSDKIGLSTQQNLETWLSSKKLNSVWIRDEISSGPLSGVASPLSVIKLHAADYALSALCCELCSDQLFVIDDDYIDAFGQIISCVVMEYNTDDNISYRGIAATKPYVDKNFLSSNALSSLSANWNSAWSKVSAYPDDSIAISSSSDLSAYVKKNSSKTFIDDTQICGTAGLSGYYDLSVIKLPLSAYELSVVGGTLSNGVLYITESDYMEMYEQQISNLTMSDVEPRYKGIAATNTYVDAKVNEIKADLKEFFTSMSATIKEKQTFEEISCDLLTAISSLCEKL